MIIHYSIASHMYNGPKMSLAIFLYLKSNHKRNRMSFHKSNRSIDIIVKQFTTNV